MRQSQAPVINAPMGTPSSPPDTPVAGSPKFSRAGPSFASTATMAGRRASIPFLGGVGSQFTHGRRVRPEDISPRSSKSSDQAADSDAGSEKSSTLSLDNGVAGHWDSFQLPRASSRVIAECDLEITECSDGDDDDHFMDSDAESVEILRPSGFSSPASGRQSPTSGRGPLGPRADRELDPRMLHGFEDLACFETDESGSEEDPEMSEYERNRKRMRLEKRQRRLTSGSLSKRTVSDRGSDEDREDLQPWDTGDPSQRRLRRKTDRWSLLSSTHAPEIIIEVKEPHSDGEMSVDSEELLQELPFWRLIEGGDSE